MAAGLVGRTIPLCPSRGEDNEAPVEDQAQGGTTPAWAGGPCRHRPHILLSNVQRGKKAKLKERQSFKAHVLAER